MSEIHFRIILNHLQITFTIGLTVNSTSAILCRTVLFAVANLGGADSEAQRKRPNSTKTNITAEPYSTSRRQLLPSSDERNQTWRQLSGVQPKRGTRN